MASKIEYGVEFQFEYFILHLRSRLLKQILKSTAITNFKFLFCDGALDLADGCGRSLDANSVRRWSEAERTPPNI